MLGRIALGFLFVLSACGSNEHTSTSLGDTGGDGGVGGSTGVPVGGVSLSVTSAAQVGSVEGTSPPAGDMYVAVSLTLTNGGSTTLPLLAPLFGVVTTSGLEFPGNALTSGYAGGCDSTASLIAGSAVSCAMIFAVPETVTLSDALYTLVSGTTVKAPIGSVTMCTICEGACVDLQSDPENCGSCGNVSPGGTCTNGVVSCEDQNYMICDNQCSFEDVTSCGPCGSPLTACTQADATECIQGHCVNTVSSTLLESCDTICGSAGCYGATADFGSQTNPECDPMPAAIDCSYVPPADISPNCPLFTQYCNCGA